MTDQVASAPATTPNSGGDANTTATSQPAVTTTAPATGGDATATTQQAPSATPPATDTPPAADPVSDPATANPEDKSASTDEPPADNTAPETYEFKAPEGFTLAETVVGELSLVAKELGLSQEAAQKLVDKLTPVIATDTAHRQAAQLETYKAELATLAKADKEFGGDKLNENLAVAKKAIDAFGTPALRELLDASGLGNHPEVIRAFYRAGKSISVDKFVTGGTQPQSGSTSAASKLYGAKT